MQVKRLDAIEGWKIWKSSWAFAKPHWLNLFIVTAVTFLAVVGSSLFPIFGAALSTLVTGVLSYGLMCVTIEIKKTNKVNFKLLFSGFESDVLYKLIPLIMIWIAIGLVQGGLTFFLNALPNGKLLAGVASILISVATISFIVFAPALVVWHDIPTRKAIDLNFEASKKNYSALLVYTLAPAIVSLLPLGVMLLAKQFLPEVLAGIVALLLLVAMFAAIVAYAPAIVVSLYFLFDGIFYVDPSASAKPAPPLLSNFPEEEGWKARFKK